MGKVEQRITRVNMANGQELILAAQKESGIFGSTYGWMYFSKEELRSVRSTNPNDARVFSSVDEAKSFLGVREEEVLWSREVKR